MGGVNCSWWQKSETRREGEGGAPRPGSRKRLEDERKGGRGRLHLLILLRLILPLFFLHAWPCLGSPPAPRRPALASRFCLGEPRQACQTASGRSRRAKSFFACEFVYTSVGRGAPSPTRPLRIRPSAPPSRSTTTAWSSPTPRAPAPRGSASTWTRAARAPTAGDPRGQLEKAPRHRRVE